MEGGGGETKLAALQAKRVRIMKRFGLSLLLLCVILTAWRTVDGLVGPSHPLGYLVAGEKRLLGETGSPGDMLGIASEGLVPVDSSADGRIHWYSSPMSLKDCRQLLDESLAVKGWVLVHEDSTGSSSYARALDASGRASTLLALCYEQTDCTSIVMEVV
jgi:hypothetical protein